MALRKLILTTKRPFAGNRLASPVVTLEHSPISPYVAATPSPQNATKNNFRREYLTPPETAEKGFFRRFLHRNSMTQLPEFLSIPVGEKLREKLVGINNISGKRLRLEGLAPPETVAGVSAEEARRVLRVSLVEKIKMRLREIPARSITYSEFVGICVDECGSNEEQGVEFAKALDLSGNVLVLGNTVFLRPAQIAYMVETFISKAMGVPNDPRRAELEVLEKEKALIDEKAEKLVKGELYCGLGFVVIQTLGFMRLTFWELTWDVMEPICFFVTSLHFAIGYGFFLKTSTEPTFEGYFHRRFKIKQKKLMETHGFDVEKYNELRKIFYPDFGNYGGNYLKYDKPFGRKDEELIS